MTSEQAPLMREDGRTEQELASQPRCWRRAGPIAVTGEGSVVWAFGTPPGGLADEITAAGGTSWFSDEHPLAELVRVHKLAVTVARARGLDPDRPRNLTRSVILAGRP